MHKFFIALLIIFFAACKQAQSPPEQPAKKVEEKSLLELGGEKQYVEITGSSDKNPVLLFMHGGPGWPETPQLRYFSADLTKDFTVIAWDQRGAGKSFMANPAPKNMTLEQITADAHELTQLLKTKFGQKKIYLVGYSWGSIIGMHLVQKYPDDYLAYIGIGQVINMKRGIAVAQEWLAKQAQAKGDQETLAALAKLKHPTKDFCAGDLACFMKQYESVLKYGAAIHNKDADKENEIAITKYEDYKGYDWNKGFEFSANSLGRDMFAADFDKVNELKTPVYFFLGRHDWNVPAVLVEEFANKLTAPKKEIVWFENSAHSPIEEEPKYFNQMMVEKVLRGK